MSKGKSITDLVTDLQNENERLKGLEKLLNSAVKMRFGMTINEIENVLKKRGKPSKFEQDLSRYFGLKTDDDKALFLTIICSDATKNYYRKKLADYTSAEADSVPVSTQG